MKLLSLLLLMIMMLTCVIATASGEKVSVQSALFYSQEVVLVRDAPANYANTRQTPYPGQVREIIDYYISAGLELKNTSQGEISKSIVCRFSDRWDKTLAAQRINITLQPGEKAYRIVNSGLRNESLSGDLSQSGLTSSISDPILSKGQQSAFLATGEGLRLGNDPRIQALIQSSLTEVRCIITQE
ncbi:MAG: hypothetical protein AB9903_19995 [Vulcanimicrobiota bacterium]